jgi:hypothetical protein
MKKTKPEWLSRDIGAAAPYYTLVLSQEEFDAELKKLKVPLGQTYLSTTHSNATTTFLTSSKGAHCAIVSLGPWKGLSGIQIACLLVHEAVHIWQEYAANIGEHTPGSEQEAYAVQSIAQRLMLEFARRTQKRKSKNA